VTANYLLVPIGAALGALLGVAFSAWVTQLIARALGGSGTYTKLVYLFAAFQAPLLIVSPLGGLPVPCLFLVSLGTGLYGLLLTVISVEAVNRFGWGRALAASSPLLAVGFLIMAWEALARILLTLSVMAQ
jgi:hypothetical protein